MPALEALLASPARGRRGGHPPRRPRRARSPAASLARSRSAPSERGIEVLKPARPRDPEFLARLRELAPGLLPGRRLRRPGAARGAGDPAARLGQPALLAAARLARRRARCSTRCWPATTSPAPRPSCSRRASTPARSSASSPSRSVPRTPAATCSTGWRTPARSCSSRRWTARRRHRWPPRPSLPTASRSRRRSPSTTPEVDWTQPAVARRPAGPRLHAGARRLDDLRRRAAQARTGLAARRRRRPLAPGELGVDKHRRAGRHRQPRRRRSARCSRRARRPMAAADWARGAPAGSPGRGWAA